LKESKSKRKVISIPEAKEILEKIDREKADQIQKRTLEYATKFSKTTAEKAKEIRKRIEDEGNLTGEEAAEIVNILPRSIEELRVFTAGWKKLIPTETLENILRIINQNA
jgi:DNA-directed RNA polymerase subunit F